MTREGIREEEGASGKRAQKGVDLNRGKDEELENLDGYRLSTEVVGSEQDQG